MPAEAIDRWLQSGRPAWINGEALRPLEHPHCPGTPLSIQKGQAEAFFLEDTNERELILKQFRPGCSLDCRYLNAVSAVLPRHSAFRAGTHRQVLSARSLSQKRDHHFDADLAQLLHGAVLMDVVPGVDWATVADELREGELELIRDHRLALARSLTQLVELLERHRCAHRDLPSGNVFIDAQTWAIVLIDFDSLYHPKLPMPQATTGGTIGYAPPFAWRNGELKAGKTWCAHADRVALTLINVEFLILDEGAPMTTDGGMFDQDELCARRGAGLREALDQLRADWPDAAQLFQGAVRSMGFDDCPSPADWHRRLDALSNGQAAAQPIVRVRANGSRPNLIPMTAQRNGSIPSLSDLPVPTLTFPRIRMMPVVPLPPDPWRK